MWKIILISACVLWGVMSTDAVGSYSASYSNSDGVTGGYNGNYNDYDDYGGGFNFGYAPDFNFGFIDPYIFHQQLTSQILAQNAAQQNAIASTIATGDATVTADASNLPNDDDNQIYRQQAALFNNIRRQNHYSSNGNRYAPNYSAAAASIGPGGGYQTAHISPGNPDIPNISTRFSSSSPGGYKGVSVSSYSSSSDVNGEKTGQRGAQTTINDNGRITTYKVNS